MDLEKLIRSHNKALEQEVDNNVSLKNRLRTRLNEKNFREKSPLTLRLRRLVVFYGIVFMFLIFFNFKLIGWLGKEKPHLTHLVTMNENPFQPVFPGSISQAYMESIKWPE